MDEYRKDKIRQLNDSFRTSITFWNLVTTEGISAFADEDLFRVIDLVKTFNNFTPDIDPSSVHETGLLEYKDNSIFWKIDYYDKALESGSEDPADPSKTKRVLIVMLTNEY